MSLNVPPVQQLSIVQGNAIPIYISLGTDCSAFDLTGAKIWFTCKRYLTDSDAAAIFQKVSTATLAIVDPTMGLTRIELLSTDTNSLPQWYYNYFCDLKLLDAAGYILTTVFCRLAVYPGVTNANS